MEFQDKTLICKECGNEFVWTAGEQEFFAQKGFRNKPTRCKDCRKVNRQKVEAEYFKITCSGCGQIGEAQFQPSDKEAKIFCKNCFETRVLVKQ
ncbi:zinc-ribbon domain-containing protein [Candidatus Berkelbacteria bacterium]|nr:zinc-ribbon domain-containing protein [Candidatus Berkelbacteria bacterium]